jgi:hypothetical protein
MRKTVAADKLTLHRYDGVDDERKSKMARIGSIPLGTKPDEIPEELIDDLTRKEFRELIEFLTQEQAKRAAQKVGGIRTDLDDVLASAASGMLGYEQIAELEKTTTDFLKRLRRIGADRKIVSVDISVP